ncbi:MAG: hypothetical protein ACON42_00540 [Flavobacteriaceae bacterium]
MVGGNSPFSDIIQSFNGEGKEHVAQLRKLVLQYPYFQPAYAYFVKGLEAQKDITHDRHLAKLSAITPDRRTLELFLQKSFGTTAEQEPTVSAAMEEKEVADKVLQEEEKSAKQPTSAPKSIKRPEENSSISSQSEKDPAAKKTFGEWLKASRPTEKSENSTLSEQLKTIDSFLAKNPSIPRGEKDTTEQQDLSLQNNFDSQELMTETLAKVFVKQQKYDQAMSAYRVLSLKYPEKSTLFADQIKKIKRLKGEK